VLEVSQEANYSRSNTSTTFADKLDHKPFWFWDTEQHKQQQGGMLLNSYHWIANANLFVSA